MKKLFRSIYKALPFKKHFFIILKKIWVPGESVYRHFHFRGVIQVPVTNYKSFKIQHYGYQVENEIFWTGLTGGWEKESIKLWIKLCQQSNCILDIGANTGVYSLVAKTINQEAQIFAFEPVKRVFEKLKKNISLNHFNITSVEKAVSNKDGFAIIFDTDSEHTYSVTVGKNLLSKNDIAIETKIETITLDSFIENNNITNVDLLKIDVETHEPEVLEGFLKYLPVFKPTILIEILSDEVGKKVYQLVNDLGYLYFNIDESSVTQQSDIRRKPFYNFLLCTPEVAKKLNLLK